MNILQRLFQKHKLNEIFTPNTVAKLAYINREKLERELSKNIKQPGRQVVIYGYSGSGKTTLTRKILNDLSINFILSHCESQSTFNDLLLNAFDNLNRFYIAEKESNRNYTISSNMKADYKSISSEIHIQKTRAEGEKAMRIVPPQLTPQKLAQFLGEIHAVWLIEDFHKIEKKEKERIADVLKIFIDAANDFSDVKIVCIGAVGTARELIELDSNLYPRISELHVPLLEEKEIKAIMHKGCSFLNIAMSNALIDKIVFYSNNLASLTHQMCYDICISNSIEKTLFFKKAIDDKYFKNAIEAYINSNSDTFKGIYDSIVSNQLAWYILKTFASIDKDSIKFTEIKSRVCANNRVFSDDEILKKIEELSSPQYNIVRFDSNSNKYSISTPFWGAFLKMQLAIENANNTKARRNRKNKNLILKNQDDIDADVYSALLKQLESFRREYRS